MHIDHQRISSQFADSPSFVFRFRSIGLRIEAIKHYLIVVGEVIIFAGLLIAVPILFIKIMVLSVSFEV